MSVMTNLYINSKYEQQDIVDILKHVLKAKSVKIHDCKGIHGMSRITFEYQNEHRTLSYHSNADTPIGLCSLISLGHNMQAIEIMKGAAKVIGGIYEENDCESHLEFINGMTWESDGLPFFIKYALINGFMKDENDIEGLAAAKSHFEKTIGG